MKNIPGIFMGFPEYQVSRNDYGVNLGGSV